MTRGSSGDAILIKRLELWTLELIRIEAKKQELAISLADLGVLLPDGEATVRPGDTLAVIRKKEQWTRLGNRADEIRRCLEKLGGALVDRQTMEVVIPSGRKEAPFLSWQPGEPTFGYTRQSNDNAGPRRPLPDHHRKSAVIH